jgi:hypothetical protein
MIVPNLSQMLFGYTRGHVNSHVLGVHCGGKLTNSDLNSLQYMWIGVNISVGKQTLRPCLDALVYMSIHMDWGGKLTNLHSDLFQHTWIDVNMIVSNKTVK